MIILLQQVSIFNLGEFQFTQTCCMSWIQFADCWRWPSSEEFKWEVVETVSGEGKGYLDENPDQRGGEVMWKMVAGRVNTHSFL